MSRYSLEKFRCPITNVYVPIDYQFLQDRIAFKIQKIDQLDECLNLLLKEQLEMKKKEKQQKEQDLVCGNQIINTVKKDFCFMKNKHQIISDQYRLLFQFRKKQNKIQTQIGIVKSILCTQKLPDGWRYLDESEILQERYDLSQLVFQSLISDSCLLDILWQYYSFRAHSLFLRFIVKMSLEMTAVFFLMEMFEGWSQNLLEEVIMQYDHFQEINENKCMEQEENQKY